MYRSEIANPPTAIVVMNARVFFVREETLGLHPGIIMGKYYYCDTYPDLIGEVLQKGRVRSIRNRRACMNVDEAKGVCKDRSR